MSQRRTTRDERGIALLMVLWTLILLAFIATVYGSNVRTQTLLTRNMLESAQAEALADSGIQRAVTGLRDDPAQGGLRGDGTVYHWQEPAGEVRFSIRDEGGKVDLNQATNTLLLELLVVVGVAPDVATSLAAAIVDFRDEDDEAQPQGAELREYRAAGLSYGPKNAPFQMLDELTYVLGMTPEIYQKIRPFITVFGQDASPHIYTAPPQVVAALKAATTARRRSNSSASGTGGLGSQRRSATAQSNSSLTGQSDSAFASTSGNRSDFGSSSSSGFGSNSSSGFGSSSSGGLGSSASGSFGTTARSSGGFGSGSSSSGFGTASSGSSTSTGSGDSAFSSSRTSAFGTSTSSSTSSSTSETDGQNDLGTGEEETEASDRSDVPIFTVHSEARTVDGTVFVREAVVDMNGNEISPYAIRDWRQGDRVLFPANGSKEDAQAHQP